MAEPKTSPIVLTGLKEDAALDCLATALAIKGVGPADCTWHLIDRGPLGLGISLTLPEVAAQACIEAHAGNHPGLRMQATAAEGEAMPLSTGLLLLLQPDAGAGDWPPSPHEHLVIAETNDPEQVDALFLELSFGATHTRVAAAHPVDQPERSLWLFHVVDDETRASTFGGTRQSGVLDGCLILRAFKDEGHTLFFPEARSPSRERFRALRHLLGIRPDLLGGSLPERGPVLAALPSSKGTGARRVIDVLWLGGVHFASEVRFQPAAGQLPSVHHIELADAADELAKLRIRIAKAGPRAGYPIRLESVQTTEGEATRERMRLRQRLAETKQRLAYLESLDQSLPVLFRFAQADLEEFAAMLADFPPEILKNGELRYAFYADELQPEGAHFLLVRPEHANMTFLGPRPFAIDSAADRFMVDPLWAGVYYEPDVSALVFAPAGQRISPSMHAWDASDMKEYLADSIRTWSEACGKVPQAVPEQPIYIFEGSESESVRVSVLDREGFAPLHERMGWINENLTITRDLGMETFIADMATASRRTEMLDQKQAQMADEEKRFAASTATLNENLNRQVRSFLLVLDAQVGRTLLQADSIRRELDGLESTLSRLKSKREEMRKSHHGEMRNLEVELLALPGELRRAKQTMDNIITQAESEREGMDGRMQQELIQLKASRERLLKAIKKELWLK